MALGYVGDIPQEAKTGLTYKGEEILLMKTRGRSAMTNHRKLEPRAGWYPEEKKKEAALVYAACLNFTKTADLTGVATSSLKKWRNEPWFLEILEEVRQENDDRLDQKFDAVLEKSIDGILDRIENGNMQMNHKTGELVRVPTSLRELTNAHSTILDKRQLLRGKPTTRSGDTSTDKLELLAKEFLKIAGATKFKQSEIIDVEVIKDGNAITDQQGNENSQHLKQGTSDLGNDNQEHGVEQTIQSDREEIHRTKLQTERS